MSHKHVKALRKVIGFNPNESRPTEDDYIKIKHRKNQGGKVITNIQCVIDPKHPRAEYRTLKNKLG